LRGIGQHRDVFPVLGCASHHGRSADVDVLDGVFQRATGLGHGRLEGIQVDDEQIDSLDAMGLQGQHVLGQIAPRQQATVHLGMQGLHPAIQHLWKCGHLGHLRDWQALVGQQLGRAAGGNEGHAQAVQGLGQLDDAAFVGDGNECAHGMDLGRD
jgi:hypothetical protein